MSLRRTLFISFAIFLLVSAILIFFIPAIVVRKDISDLSNQIQKDLPEARVKQSIEKSMGHAGEKIAWKISFQLFLIIFFFFAGAAFLFNQRLLIILIRPLLLLSEATQKVVAGEYTDVQLPSTENRNDEIATLIHSFQEMLEGLKEKEKIRAVLDKVVSKDVAKAILQSNIQLGGEDRRLTVLFADIRDFTEMTGEMSPQEMIGMLNHCMTKATQAIDGEGGVVDKYIGDAVMAIFGAPTSNENHALNGVSAGLMIVKASKKWNERRAAQGLAPVNMGIGIHTGPVVVGNMGAEDRLNYTVLGRNVNLASRLCQIADPSQVLITLETLNEPGVKEGFIVEKLEAKKLKGFMEPIPVYQVLDFKWDRVT